MAGQEYQLNDRLGLLGEYPFRRLTALLAGIEPPAGRPPRLLQIGEPQLPVPALALEALVANAALYNKYPPAIGTPDFRRAVAAWLTGRYRLPDGMIDPETGVIPAPGTREALFQLGLAAIPTTRDGRQPAVLMPNPFYQVYAAAAVFGRAEPVLLDAPAETGFLPDLDAVPPALWRRCAIFYLCSPANPQGTVAPPDYIRRLLRLAREHGFVLAMDECYAELYSETPPAGALDAAMAEGGALDNLVIFHSLSKRSSCPGLRSGFVAGDPRIIAAMLKVMDYGGAGMPLPVQAAAAALWSDEAHVLEIRAVYRANFDCADRLIGQRFGYRRPPGGFFLWLDVGDGEAAAKALWQKAGLRTLPGRYLARDPVGGGVNPGARFLRVALVHPPEVIEPALTDLVAVLDAMREAAE